MKIGIFPGSFNPVHIGHLALANHICVNEFYDEIWFLVTPQNPLKGKSEIISQELRLKFVEDSIQGFDRFKTCTIEWDMPKPTYTINTLQKLKIMYPEDSFELIIGSDNWEVFHRWKDYQRILNNFKVLVYPRRGSNRPSFFHPNARFCKAPMLEISSSYIRKNLREGKDIRFFLSKGIYENIIAEKIFEEQKPEEQGFENEIDIQTNDKQTINNTVS